MVRSTSLIRTRFAPSPTGELHVGGARTALFCYLLAKKNNGKFILRVEDTDLERNKEEYINNQYNDLLWLGICSDESIFNESEHGPYRQTQRLEIYKKYIDKLIQEKKAYYCFCSAEELAKEKDEYIKNNNKSNYQYSRKCLQLSEKMINDLLQKNAPYVLRLQVPREREYKFNDLVRKEVVFQGQDIEDFVLFRQNGIPNYNFACVVDDHLMQISHVLRGEEHLSNTGKQLALYEALGWNSPLFGHISIILNKERKKLSKRDKETSQWQLIKQLREKGYLAQAIINYLLLLGWHPGTTQEIFSLSEAIQLFNLQGLNTRGAVYSLEKLNWYNNYYIQKLSEIEFGENAWEMLKNSYNLSLEKKIHTIKIASLFRPQLNYFGELINLAWYFFQDVTRGEKDERLNNLVKNLSLLKNWGEEEIKSALQLLFLNNKKQKKELFLIIRRKLTGQEKGPELPKIIYLLGKDTTIQRLKY